jgi:hypothetical protein
MCCSLTAEHHWRRFCTGAGGGSCPWRPAGPETEWSPHLHPHGEPWRGVQAGGATGAPLLGHDGPMTTWLIPGVAKGPGYGSSTSRAGGVAPSPGAHWLEVTFQLSFAGAAVAGLARVTRRRSVDSGGRRTR